jgi:hypothetical protein
MMALQKRRAVKRVCLSGLRFTPAGITVVWGCRLDSHDSPEQIENMLHPTREVNSPRVAAVRPRVFARPGPSNRGPAPAHNTVVALWCRHGGRSAPRRGAAAALFAAGIAARTRGKVLWCLTRLDLFAPALAQAGLNSDRVIYLEGGDEKTILACFEEGLRHGGLGAVVAEVARLPMTASRRLQLAAEGSGTIGIALRRWRRQTEASDFGQPTAATTRWRVSALPSTALPGPGCRPPALARGTDPLPRWRKRGFRIGGVRCHGSSPSSCRPCRPTGSGGRRAIQRLCLRRRSSWRAGWKTAGRLGGRRGSPCRWPPRRHARRQGPGAGAGPRARSS